MVAVAELAFDLEYDGDALDTHEMNVRDLAPALLAAAELFQASNEVLRPADPPITVNVRALAEGSFLVQLKLVYDAAVDALVSEDVQAGSTLLGLVTAVGSLIGYLRRKHDQAVVSVEPSDTPGTIRIIFEDGTVLEVPREVLTLEQSVQVRRRLSEMVRPLDREGISTVRILDIEGIEIALVGKDDLAALEDDIPTPPREVLSDTDQTVFLTVLSATFQEDHKWRFSDGTSSFWASVTDPAFLQKVDEGEKFAKLDVLNCRIHAQQWRDSTGLHRDVEVIEVIEHRPHVARFEPEQIVLELDGPLTVLPAELAPDTDDEPPEPLQLGPGDG